MEFHHPYFVKDKEHMLELIKRKVFQITSIIAPTNPFNLDYLIFCLVFFIKNKYSSFLKTTKKNKNTLKQKVPSAASSHQIKKEDNNEEVDITAPSSNINKTNNSTASAAAASSPSSKTPHLNTENLVAILHGVKSMHAKQADVVDRLQYLKRF